MLRRLGFLLVVAAGLGAGLAGALALERSRLVIVAPPGRHAFDVEIAATAADRERGLMFRRNLAPDAGMLFDYGAPTRVSMWMKNTYIPLDMLYVADDGRIIHIVERTIPHSLTPLSAARPVRAVLELNAGTAARLELRLGDTILHTTFGNAE